MGAVDYGEFEPRKSIEGGSITWPLSWASQMNEARNHLRRCIVTTGGDVQRGGQVLVHWNRLPPTRLRWREVDGLDYYDELDPTTGDALPARTWESLRAHVSDVQSIYGVKPHDRPPGAPRPE